MALFAEDALWYFTIAVVKLLPKLSCSMRHFYNAPSVENNLYKSSLVKSGCNPMTFKVLPFSWAALSSFSFETFLGGFSVLGIFPLTYLSLEILEILEPLLPPLYLTPYLTSRLNFFGPLSYLSSLFLLNFPPSFLWSAFLMPRCLSEGPRLNFLCLSCDCYIFRK